MFLKVLRAGSAVALLISVLQTSYAEDDVSTLSTVYSEFVPAYTTYPEFSTSAVTVISSDDFSASDITVADVLEQAPSVQIQETGETGSYSSIRVRGAPSQQTQIYIDGVIQPNVAGEGGNLNNLLLNDVERIEIYPGSSPTLLMQGSPGGAVNIVRKQNTTSASHLLFELGSFDHVRTAGGGNVVDGNWSSSASFEVLNVENDFEFTNDANTPDDDSDDYTDTRSNAAYQLANITVATSYQQDENQYSIALSYFESKKELPDYQNSDIEEAYYDQTDISALFSANLNQWAEGVDSSIRIQLLDNQGHYYDPDSAIGWNANDSEDQLLSAQINQTTSKSLEAGVVSLSNSLSHDCFTLEDSIEGTTVDASRSQFSSALSSEWFINKLTATASLRHLIYRDDSGDESDSSNLYGGQLGLRYDQNKVSVQSGLQYSYRVANLIERYGNIGSFVGNDELENEQAISTDIAFGYTANSYQTSLTAFYRYSENPIIAIYSSGGVGQYINLESAEYIGLEWQLEKSWQTIRLSSIGSVQDSIIHSQVSSYDGNQVPGYYPLSLKQSISWNVTSSWQAGLSHVYEDGLYYDRANSTKAPTKEVVNAELVWRKSPWQLSAKVENLFNDYYLDYDRKVVPGRSYTITLEFK
ncbi:TonB-dependent receptor [Reinekea marinisedimentorum]|uniref:Outer membrane cobalamin receptor n=1 Tax=Reinekea marinisedimentorum TaxID=230495 RepID=A0A4R3I2N0_9GAMM|nr:TonB-dependent receptor plug domain-containing protein [Reinekea marinisedimentorum]TCS38159.1 outer membrane cobalamin receptor [Reinekea marinisedimentorum]